MVTHYGKIQKGIENPKNFKEHHYEILAEMQKIRGDLNGNGIVLRVNPDIVRALQEEERGVLRDLRATLGRDLTLKPDARLHHEQFDVMAM